MDKNLYENALEYHRCPKPGKLSVMPTKPMATQRDLSLAYSPGVAAACQEIVSDEVNAYEMTIRGNLVAVVTNGTAVLGLGDIGPLAAKPVMEGKAALFKKFAGIDVFDLEIAEKNPQKLIDIVASLEPTFGGINLEDIKAPECFVVERELTKRMKIPVFHDDQHGTAIIVGAAVTNGLEVVKKKISDVKLVCSGAGAAALACLGMLELLGLKRKNIFVADLEGVVYEGREKYMDEYKSIYAQKTTARTLDDIIQDADIFLGLSAGGVLKPEMLKKMAKKPLVLALANPTPEIDPREAREVRPDAIVATGRSDFPNQVNNVLCFPFIFRGALDVGATCINEAMKIACVKALCQLTKSETNDIVASVYESSELSFGPEYIIPKPFDPRLMMEIAPAVAKAAMDSGVARKPIKDLKEYKEQLTQYIFRSSMAMKPIFAKAKEDPKRIAYADGEDERILQGAQVALDEGIARPILIGRRRVVQTRLERLGLRMQIDRDFELVDPEDDRRFNKYWQAYHAVMARKGVSPDFAKTVVRTNTTVIAALMVKLGDADCMLCGPVGKYRHHLEVIREIIGLKEGVTSPASLNVLSVDKGVFFFSDGYVNQNPNVQELTDVTLLASEQVRQFGLKPKVALICHSNYGTSDTPTTTKMREAVRLLHTIAPELEVDGEMHADSALDPAIRARSYPNSKLTGSANLLIMPDIDVANVSINLMKCMDDAQLIGPLLLGFDASAHILSTSTTVRGVYNMTAFAVVEAQRHTHVVGNAINFAKRAVT